MFGRSKGLQDFPDFAQKLLVEEYITLRSESHQALAYAQGVVRWSMAIFGAVLAATLLAAENAPTAPAGYSFLTTTVLLLFGFGIPGIIWVAAWTWLGELIRMVRVGPYLRALEARIGQDDRITSVLGYSPVGWETFLTDQARVRSPLGRTISAYLGTACAFAGASLVSVVLFVLWWGEMFAWNWTGTYWLWLAGAGIWEAVACAVALSLYRRLALISDIKITI